ncbi:MAG: type VI secretion system baseplate subunit TssG [Pseudomonadota bacterium]|nr:type VI secretion system baseplate subunit TssG [Pseudomonadales bacterium]MDY6920084.1 type VI secretion system baseplate subunit TssG [Pseudomonadota bacterium]
MESQNRLVPAAVKRHLQHSSDYSFFQLSQLLREFCDVYSEVNGQRLSLRYRALPSLAFPAADVPEGQWLDDARRSFIELTVSFMGLYGPASPLPAYYTERILQSDDPQHPSRDLLDLFNHRLLELLQRCWSKYRYYVQYHATGADQYSRWLLAQAGVDQIMLCRCSRLRWSRLLPLAGLLAKAGCSADRLCKIVRSYFRLPEVTLEPWVPRQMQVPSWQTNALGMQHHGLGQDLIMGDSVADRSSKFRLHLRDLTPGQQRYFLPDGEGFRELTELVELALTDPLEFDLCLHLASATDAINREPFCVDNGLGWTLRLGSPDPQWPLEPVCLCVADYGSF